MNSIDLNYNKTSDFIQRSFMKATQDVQTAMERLSTGYRINSAKDGAADLAIANSMDSKIRGYQVAQSNVQHAVSMTQTSDEVQGLIEENLIKIKELATKAATGSYSAEQRTQMELEAQGYADQIEQLANSTEFNGIKLLDGSVTEMNIQTGPDSADKYDIKAAFSDSTMTGLGFDSKTITSSFDSQSAAQTFMAKADAAIEQINSNRAATGAVSQTLSSISNSIDVRSSNLQAAESTIRDADVAAETANLAMAQIKQQSSLSLLAQANQMPAMAISLIQGSSISYY